MLMYKKVIVRQKSLTDMRSSGNTEIAEPVLSQQIALMNRILGYADSLVWLRNRFAREVLCYLRNNDFDYGKAADDFKFEAETIYRILLHADEVLESKVGRAYDLLLRGEVWLAESKFEQDVGLRYDDVFTSEIREDFRPKQKENLRLEDCEQELIFLSNWSQRKYSADRMLVDEDKVNHLMYIFTSSNQHYNIERNLLYRCFESEVEVEEALRHYKESKQISFFDEF